MGDEKVVKLTAGEALGCLPPKGKVHVFMNPGGMLIGADWSRVAVKKLLKGSPRIEIAGKLARDMKHGIVAFEGNEPRFVAHVEDRLAEIEARRG